MPTILAAGEEVVVQDGLTDKHPRLILNVAGDLRFGNVAEETFDFLLAQSVFTHLPQENIEECFAHVGSVMHDQSRFFFTIREGRQRRTGFEFQYPAAFIVDMAKRYGLSANVRADYPHPSGQTMVVATKLKAA